MVLAAILLATLVNPYGYEYLLAILPDFGDIEPDRQIEAIGAYVPMWQRFFQSSLHHLLLNAALTTSAWLTIVLYLAIVALQLYILRRRGSFDPLPIAIATLFFLFALSMSRAALYFPAVALYTIIYMITVNEIQVKRGEPVFIFALFGLFIYAAVDRIYLEPEEFGDDLVVEQLVPSDALGFFEENSLSGVLFNDYLSGSHVLWRLYPETTPFIDPRYQPYSEETRHDYFAFRGQPSVDALGALQGKYGFDLAFVQLRVRGVISAFALAPGWEPVYFDRFAAIYVHSSRLAQWPEGLRERINKAGLGPDRFADIDNPQVLIDLFLYYVTHRSLEEARTLRDIFIDTVRPGYFRKLTVIAGMDRTLARAGLGRLLH